MCSKSRNLAKYATAALYSASFAFIAFHTFWSYRSPSIRQKTVSNQINTDKTRINSITLNGRNNSTLKSSPNNDDFNGDGKGFRSNSRVDVQNNGIDVKNSGIDLKNSGIVDGIRRRKPPIIDKNRNISEIIFIRTSTGDLESFELCTLFSAARHNPTYKISLLSPRVFKFPEYFGPLGNVQSRQLNYTPIFKDTPLEEWFISQVWDVPHFLKRVRFLSDAVRLAYLYKYGGFYMDTDLINMRSVKGLVNILGKQQGGSINNNWMGFKPGHDFVHFVMLMVSKKFDPEKDEIEYGPKILSYGMELYRRLYKIFDWQPPPTVINKEYSNPIGYMNAAHIHFKPLSQKSLNLIRDSYTLHLWRNKIRNNYKYPTLKPMNGTLIMKVVKEHCAPALKTWL